MELLADTHVLIWYVLSAEKLSVTTRERIVDGPANQGVAKRSVNRPIHNQP